MKVLQKSTKFAHLGKPGTIFSDGFQRRLNKIIRIIDIKDKRILDQGCGEGVWLTQFMKYTDSSNVFGVDIDPEGIKEFISSNEDISPNNLKVCPAEKLDFPDNYFDIVFSNEVLEHVEDDKKAVHEVIRVLKPGGYFVVFTPNRGWPFETHGMFWRSKYYWGNIPLLPWFPAGIRKHLAPHVRNYSNGDIRRLFSNIPVTIVHWKHVFPGFDGMARRFGIFGRMVCRFIHALEYTPLHFFGISHFVIIKKKST